MTADYTQDRRKISHFNALPLIRENPEIRGQNLSFFRAASPAKFQLADPPRADRHPGGISAVHLPVSHPPTPFIL